MPRIAVSILFLASLLPLGALAQPSAEPTPVIVAVDTSRSLSAAALARVGTTLGAAVRGLPAGTPVGLLVFDDEPRWEVEPGASPAAVAAALGSLAPSGNFTLLNDALFVAARALERGGVIVLATDGRDENSATTVEDIARRSETQGVRIVALGVGQGVEERALRRLALLTNGEYAGALDRVDPATLGTKIAAVQTQVAAARPAGGGASGSRPAATAEVPAPATSTPNASVSADAAPTTAASAGPSPGSVPRAGGATSGLAGWLLPLILALALLLTLGLLTMVLARRSRARPRPAVAERDDLELHGRLAEREPAPSVEAEDVSVDTAVFHNLGEGAVLEKTRVLSGQGLLWMRRPGEDPRSFVLPRDKAFAVGRDPENNTLTVPDPALSTHHFKIVFDDGEHFLVDLHSTNGSFVNGERVLVRKLRNGDVIHVGQLELDFRSLGGSEA